MKNSDILLAWLYYSQMVLLVTANAMSIIADQLLLVFSITFIYTEEKNKSTVNPYIKYLYIKSILFM